MLQQRATKSNHAIPLVDHEKLFKDHVQKDEDCISVMVDAACINRWRCETRYAAPLQQREVAEARQNARRLRR